MKSFQITVSPKNFHWLKGLGIPGLATILREKKPTTPMRIRIEFDEDINEPDMQQDTPVDFADLEEALQELKQLYFEICPRESFDYLFEQGRRDATQKRWALQMYEGLVRYRTSTESKWDHVPFRFSMKEYHRTKIALEKGDTAEAARLFACARLALEIKSELIQRVSKRTQAKVLAAKASDSSRDFAREKLIELIGAERKKNPRYSDKEVLEAIEPELGEFIEKNGEWAKADAHRWIAAQVKSRPEVQAALYETAKT